MDSNTRSTESGGCLVDDVGGGGGRAEHSSTCCSRTISRLATVPGFHFCQREPETLPLCSACTHSLHKTMALADEADDDPPRAAEPRANALATASRALNDYPSVGKEERDSVLKAAAQLGYVPNGSARA
mgnify:CR=1 FL=1